MASGPCLVDGLLELVGHQVQGLVPGGLPELAVGLDQRHRQPFRGVDEVIAEAAFDTETALVGSGAFHPGDLDDLAALDVQPQLAAHAAVRTGGANLPGFPGPGLADGFQLQQGAHRAGLHALAAKDAVRIAISIIRAGDDLIVRPPVADADGLIHLLLIAGPHTAAAHDALGKIPADQILIIFEIIRPCPAGWRNWGSAPDNGTPGPATRRRHWLRRPGSYGCRRPTTVRAPSGGRRPPYPTRS